MERIQINIDGIVYESHPEQRICQGCAFHSDEHNLADQSQCLQANEYADCITKQIIWKKAAVKTASGTMSKQVGGSHYQKKIQPWDIIAEWNLDYWRGNVIKYVLRAPEKNGVEDIKKAIHYLEYIVENYVKDRK